MSIILKRTSSSGMTENNPSGREDLGWLAQSSAIPRKRKAIEGVTGSSLLELQAQFYHGQESVADGSWKEAARKSRRHAGIALFEKKNAGVEQRDASDKLFVKSADQILDESRAALEKKAELYDKFVRGEKDDDDDVYEVDFFTKVYKTDSLNDPDDAYKSVNDHLDISRIVDKHQQEQQQDAQRRQLHKEFVREIANETMENRDKAEDIQLHKKQLLQSSREKLKEAFLEQKKKKLKKQIRKNKDETKDTEKTSECKQ